MRSRIMGFQWLLCVTVVLFEPVSGWAQSGSLQVSPQPGHDTAAKAPLAVPRQPVQKAGALPVAPPGRLDAPVLKPHGPLRPHKPPNRPGHPNRPAGAAPGNASKAPPSAAQKPTDETPSGGKPAAADTLAGSEKPEGGTSRLPRFAALRADEVNMRVGPGTRYRIEWVYRRRDLPVEIVREFDVWRWVRDADGIQGWVHGATLMGRRNFVIQTADATLRYEPNDSARAVAILKPGVIGRIRSCEVGADWCNVQTGSYRGFLRRAQFWGVLPGEAVTP